MPVQVVYEDSHSLAFLDINPRSPKHTLVIPKIHSETILDLPESEREPFWGAVVAVEKLLLESIHPNGFTLGINQWKAAGQEVDHLHMHIIPRFLDDGGGPVQMIVNNPKN